MTESTQALDSRWRVPLSQYRDNLLEVAGAVSQLVQTDRNLAGSLIMRPIEWPKYCVICSVANPDDSYEVTFTRVIGGMQSGGTTTTYRRKGVPICNRCNNLKRAGELVDHCMIGTIIVGVLGVLVMSFGLYALLFTHGPLNESASALIVGLLIVVVAPIAFYCVRMWFLRTHPDAKDFPWSTPVSMDESQFFFRNQDYAQRFAQANSASAFAATSAVVPDPPAARPYSLARDLVGCTVVVVLIAVAASVVYYWWT